MIALGRVLPIAVQHGNVRYLGNDSHHTEKLMLGRENLSAGPSQNQSVTVTNSVGFPACDADGLLRLRP